MSIKMCDNCKKEKDLQVWYGHTIGWICNDCAASIYHQEYIYNKKEIISLKDKLTRRNKQIKELRQKLNDKYKCNKCDDVFNLSEVAHLS